MYVFMFHFLLSYFWQLTLLQRVVKEGLIST